MRPSTIAVVAFFAVLGCQPQTGSLSEADLAAIRSLPAAFDQGLIRVRALGGGRGVLPVPHSAVA